MSFLSLSPLAVSLLAAATAAAVLALFFLKLRHRRVVVGSSLLWEKVLRAGPADSLIERLRRLLSLLLALTIALLIALSLGRPWLDAAEGGPRPVVLVLDTSETMRALTASGRTRWEAAVEAAEDVLAETVSPAGVMAADTSGLVRTPVTDDAAEVRGAIARMRPFPGDGRFPEVPVADARVFYITDGVRSTPGVPDDAALVSVFEPADNVGVTAFEIADDPTSPSGYSAYVQVANYSPSAKRTDVVVAGVGGQRIVRTADLESGGAWSETFDLEGFAGGGVQVRARADGDRFPADDEAFGYLPARGGLRVTLVTADPGGHLRTLLELAPEVELNVTSPAAFDEAAAADVYVFDGVAPPAAPRRPSLLFGPPGAEWLPRILGRDTDVGISSWDEAHPLMRFVPVQDLGIDEAAAVDPDGRTVIASSGGTPLILIDEDAGPAEAIIVTFGLDESDFALHLGFPIFVENALRWFSGETLPESRRVGEIELPEGAAGIRRLDGTPVEAALRSGRPVVQVTDPDLLTATVDGRRYRIAANMTDPETSNINRTSLVDARATVTPPAGSELWIPMLVAATLLIALEWWTYHRRITL